MKYEIIERPGVTEILINGKRRVEIHYAQGFLPDIFKGARLLEILTPSVAGPTKEVRPNEWL